MKLLPTRAPAALLDPVARALIRARVTPGMLTVGGFAGNLAAAVAIVRGELPLAGALVLVFSALDLLDGAVARQSGTDSPLGALYDSVLDRLSEAVVLGGVLFYQLERGHDEESLLAFAAVVGSLMVSYVRARAEGLGVTMRSGLFTRPERVVVVAVALLFGWLRPALWLLAIATLLTTGQRVWDARRLLLGQSSTELARADLSPTNQADPTTGGGP